MDYSTVRPSAQIQSSLPVSSMLSTPQVVFYAPVQVAVPGSAVVQAWVQHAHAQGLSVAVANSLPELYTQLTGSLNPANTVVLLAGSQNENCAIASYLRGQLPRLGLLGVVSSPNISQLEQLLQSGVDLYLPPESSASLIMVAVLRLLARAGAAQAVPPAAEGGGGIGKQGTGPALNLDPEAQEQRSGCWELTNGNTVIVSPLGRRIPLSSQERVIFTFLLGARELRAEHEQLIQAIGHHVELQTRSDGELPRARLSVVISRLRKKFERYGEELPISSVHRWGYMFTGPTRAASASPDSVAQANELPETVR